MISFQEVSVIQQAKVATVVIDRRFDMPEDNRTSEQRAAERSAKLDAIHERLTAAVEGPVTGDYRRRATEFGARFRSRSFRNSRLIEVQHLEAYNLGMVPQPFPA